MKDEKINRTKAWDKAYFIFSHFTTKVKIHHLYSFINLFLVMYFCCLLYLYCDKGKQSAWNCDNTRNHLSQRAFSPLTDFFNCTVKKTYFMFPFFFLFTKHFDRKLAVVRARFDRPYQRCAIVSNSFCSSIQSKCLLFSLYYL